MEAKNEKILEAMESVYERNEKLAIALKREFTRNKVYTINMMGSPGAGKTSVLMGLIQALDEPSFVIEGDIESDIDARKLKALGVSAFQINTGGACHLDAPLVRAAAKGHYWRDCFLFIENIGNLVCPAEFLIGEHCKMLIASITEGSDKPYKYPLAFEKADLIVLNKMDLLPYTQFDEAFFLKGVRALNKTAPIIKLSAVDPSQFEGLATYMRQRRAAAFTP